MNRLFLNVVLGFLIIGIGSCNSSEPFDPIARLNSEITAIDNYLAANNIEAEEHVSGIRIEILSLGDQLPASLYTDPIVDVDYKGMILNGGTFANSSNTDDNKVSGFIPGWQIALRLLPVGSRANVYIPSYYGYGNAQQGSIPANSTLVFEITFNEVQKTTAEINKFKADTATIHTHLKTNNINATYDPLGIWYQITQNTAGPMPSWYDKVKVKYTFKSLSGTSYGTYAQEPVDGQFDSRVIDYLHGLKVGLQKMPLGSKATLYVPSGLGFASQVVTDNANNTIPADSNLIIEVELLDIVL